MEKITVLGPRAERARSGRPGRTAGRSTLLALVFFVLAGLGRSASDPHRLVVVVNDASPESLEVAHYYRQARGIPDACFCHVRVEPRHDISRQAYEQQILAPLLAHLAREGLTAQARCIVFTKGLPYRIGWQPSVQVAVTTPAAAGAMAIEPLAQQPYFRAEGAFRGRPGLPYLSICLTGYTVDDVKRCIDQGVASDGTFPKGTVYLFDGVGPRARVDPAYGRAEALTGLARLGIEARVRPGHDLTGEQDVLGYWTGAVRVNTKGLRFRPGALADHLTSFGGILFDNRSQMSILDFIAAGATGSYGTVMEPTNIPTRHSQGWVFCRYGAGLSLVESYWASVQDVRLGVFVGEPLARPFARPLVVAIAGSDAKRAVSGVVPLTLTARPGSEGVRLREVHWWVDGRPFGPAAVHGELAGQVVSARIGERSVSAVFDTATGVPGLVAALGAAINADPELAKPDGVEAVARGSSLTLRARRAGSAGNGTEVSIATDAKDLVVEPASSPLRGGAPTQELPARLELTITGGELSAGDSITLLAGDETYTAAIDAADLAQGDPLTALVRKLIEPMRASRLLAPPQARGGGRPPRQQIAVLLTSAGRGEAGNGQSVEIRVKKAEQSKLAVRPSGQQRLEGGAVRHAFASSEIDVHAPVPALEKAVVPFDTTRLGDGWHELRLVAEEDSKVGTAGFATTTIRIANGATRVLLSAAKPTDAKKPIAFTVSLTGSLPGGPKRLVLLADGREVAEFDPRTKKLALDRTAIPLAPGKHRFQARAEPKKAGALPVTSDPLELELGPPGPR